jgi:hypothetical protein
MAKLGSEKSINKAKFVGPYADDHCPKCGAKCTNGTRCPPPNQVRGCDNGHMWRREVDGSPVMLGDIPAHVLKFRRENDADMLEQLSRQRQSQTADAKDSSQSLGAMDQSISPGVTGVGNV